MWVPRKIPHGISSNLSFSTAAASCSGSRTEVVAKAQTWTCQPEAGMLSKQLKSKASLREALPPKDALRYPHGSAFSVGKGAVLRCFIWGLRVQKGSGAYALAKNLNCLHFRLFWKKLSQIPGPRALWIKFLSHSGRPGRYCTSKTMPPRFAAETRKQGQRYVD